MRVLNFCAAMLGIAAAGASVTAFAVNGETDAAWFVAILSGLSALVLSTPLGRVRVAIVLGWSLAIFVLPMMLFSVEDEAKKGRYVAAGVETAGYIYLATRWLNWMDRLRARRAQLVAANRLTDHGAKLQIHRQRQSAR